MSTSFLLLRIATLFGKEWDNTLHILVFTSGVHLARSTSLAASPLVENGHAESWYRIDVALALIGSIDEYAGATYTVLFLFQNPRAQLISWNTIFALHIPPNPSYLPSLGRTRIAM
ncbi:unnamed protein product [Clonostachys rhizophaga]|uniref:Uncharacterized protein n=1 Tax=Clonostachys rhizophaga TaxID=160324 RepID=A0A9N9VEZ6_9HYPO|nr:unnamed protein product [Clonostachys rhizophaga]